MKKNEKESLPLQKDWVLGDFYGYYTPEVLDKEERIGSERREELKQAWTLYFHGYTDELPKYDWWEKNNDEMIDLYFPFAISYRDRFIALTYLYRIHFPADQQDKLLWTIFFDLLGWGYWDLRPGIETDRRDQNPFTDKQKEVFYLKLFFYTEDEIAERMGITQQAVSQINKGIKKKMAKYKRLTQGLDLPRFLRIKFEKMWDKLVKEEEKLLKEKGE